MDIELLRLLTQTNLCRTRAGLYPLGVDQRDNQIRLVERHNSKLATVKPWCEWTTLDNIKIVLKNGSN